jgi:hypothetical protein
MPEVCVRRWRTVIPLHSAGAFGKNFVSGSERELPHRARLEDRLGLHRDLVLDVGEAVALRLQKHHHVRAFGRQRSAGVLSRP